MAWYEVLWVPKVPKVRISLEVFASGNIGERAANYPMQTLGLILQRDNELAILVFDYLIREATKR